MSQELCLYAKRAQLRCQGSSLATANRAKLLKIPDLDYAMLWSVLATSCDFAGMLLHKKYNA